MAEMQKSAESHKSAPPVPSHVPVDDKKSDNTPTIISKSLPHPPSAEAYAQEMLRGRKLAHFELLDTAGVGGMAAVLKARDTELDRVVALKILPPDMAKDPENVERFRQEARSAARLDHENIARVFYCGEDQSLHFIAFEFVEGDNLRNILERRGRLPVKEAVNYMLQVAAGLAHAASRSVVHRDIKPSNIIITPTGRAKLVDMGLARNLGQPIDKGLTHSGVTLGTFDYISPEQALEPREVDVRSDIYSLGCTFYHILTGHPPVPEGTAAKKLKHHQVVAPIDPRQFNPEISEEVTNVLAKMMAKDPQDRYQRAEHLVQHLLQLAQHMGSASTVPEGMLFVDAALPTRPRSRPLLTGGCAALAILIVVFILGKFGKPPSSSDPFPSSTFDSLPRRAGVESGSGSEPVLPGQGSGKPKSDVPRKTEMVYNSREPSATTLAKFLTEAQQVRTDAEAVVTLHGDLDLNGDLGATLLAFRGHKLTVQSADPRRSVTIRLRGPGQSIPGKKLHSILEADCDEVVLKGIRFVLDAEEAVAPLACVLLKNTTSAHVEQCEFVQAQSPSTSGKQRMSAVLLEDRRSERQRGLIVLKHCAFVAGESLAGDGSPENPWALANLHRSDINAISLNRATELRVQQCVFGPHAALLHLNDATGEKCVASMENCSGQMVGSTSVVTIENGVNVALEIRKSLFGRVGSPEGKEEKGIVLIRQTDDAVGNVDFRGDDNRYYKFDSFRVRGSESIAPADRPLSDDKSVVLKESPWENETPLRDLERLKLREAFLPGKQRLDLLRQKDAPRLLVGVDRVPWSVPFEVSLPQVPGKTIRYVDPEVKQSGNGEYPTLTQAILDSRPGDEIQLRFKGVCKERCTVFDRADLDLTIKPHPGSQPILQLDEQNTPDAEPTLFRILKGKVTFENVEFLLQPQPNGVSQIQSLFTLYSDCQVSFRSCVFTLERTQKNVSLTAFRLEDPPTVESKPVRPERKTTLHFEECFVRAEGDFLRVRGNKPFDFKANESLFAVAGCLIHVETPGSPMPAQSLRLDLNRTTAWLGNNLLRMQAGKDVRGAVPLNADAANCLFVAMNVDPNPLIYLDGLECGEEKMNSLFTWKANQTAYVNFTRMLDQKTRDGSMAPMILEKKEWSNIDAEGKFYATTRPNVPDTIAQTLPAQFKPRVDNLISTGADLDRLPTPRWNAEK